MAAAPGPHAAAQRDWEGSLSSLQARALRRHLRSTERLEGGRVRVGRTEAVSFGSCDYLGLAGHPALAEAAAEAARLEGTSSGAARLLTGQTPRVARLEAALAEAFGEGRSTAALVFGSGYLANLAVVTTLAGEGDLLVSDRLNHASTIDACRLSGATTRVFDHNDADDLTRCLADAGRFGRAVVVVEGVYSMDGDRAPLARLCDVAEAAGALVVVDDAHGLGAIGPGGGGACAADGVAGRVSARIGNLGKALGSYGAFVLADPVLRELLVQSARSFVFTCALPPTVLAAAEAALAVLAAEPERRVRLSDNARRLRATLGAAGVPVPPGDAPIVPVAVGEPDRAVALADRMLARGWLVPAIRPPSVPPGSARLRFTVTAAHTSEQLYEVAAVLAEELDER